MSGKRKPGGKSNAVRDGIFAKELLITGEDPAELEKLQSRWNKDFPFPTAIQEMLLKDLITVEWQRGRVRRAEAAKIRQQMQNALYKTEFDEIGEVENLKSSFFSLTIGTVTSPTSRSRNKWLWSMILQMHISSLNVRKTVLQSLQTISAKNLPAHALLLPEEQARFDRADSALDRRQYRALQFLLGEGGRKKPSGINRFGGR